MTAKRFIADAPRLVLFACLTIASALVSPTIMAGPPPTTPIAIGETVAGEIALGGRGARYSFEAAPGQVVYLDRTAVGTSFILNWQLEDRYGRVLGGDDYDMRDVDAISLVGGEYTIEVTADGNSTGTFEFTVVDATPSRSATSLGDTISGDIERPGEIHVWTFDAEQGTSLLIDSRPGTSLGLDMSLADEHGRYLVPPRSSATRDAGPFRLAGGTYALEIDMRGDGGGSYLLHLVSPSDATTAVSIGDTVSGSIANPGDRQRYVFDAAAGDRILLDVLASSSIHGTDWSLTDAYGRELLPLTTALTDAGPFVLDAGAHTILVDGEGGETSTFEFHVRRTSVTTTAVAMGDTVADEIEPGDRDEFTFDAVPGQILRLDQITTSNLFGLNWQLEDEVGRAVLPRTSHLLDVTPMTLQGGSYTLAVVGEGGASGTYEFVLEDQGVDGFTPSGTPIDTGVAIAGAIGEAGDPVRYTFELSGTRWTFFDQERNNDLQWKLFDPAGGTVFGPVRVSGSGDQGPFLLRAGVYSLVFEPFAAGATPAIAFTVHESVESTQAVAIGESVSSAIDGPGQRRLFTFDVADSETIVLDAESVERTVYWTLTDPFGNQVFPRYEIRRGDHGPFTLAPGTYTITVDANGPATPGFAFRVRQVAAHPESVIAIGDVVDETLGLGETRRYAFDVPAGGARLLFDNQLDAPSARWSLFDAAGQAVFSDLTLRSDVASVALAGGTCHLDVRALEVDVPVLFQVRPTVTRVVDLALDEVVEDTLGDGTPNGLAIYRFDVVEGETIFVDSIVGSRTALWTLRDERGESAGLVERVRSDSSQGPFDLAAGSYELTLEPSTTVAAPFYSFAVRRVPVDLAPTALRADPPAVEAGFSTDIEISWTIENRAGAETIDLGDWIDRVVLSSDDVLGDADDIVLDSFAQSGSVPPRETYERTEVVTVPAALPMGHYRLFVVTDADDQIEEVGSEDNNALSVPFSLLASTDDAGCVEFDLRDGESFPAGTLLTLSGRALGLGRTTNVLYIVDVSTSTQQVCGLDCNFDGALGPEDDLNEDNGAGNPNGECEFGSILDCELGAVLRTSEVLGSRPGVHQSVILFAAFAESMDLGPDDERQHWLAPHDRDADESGVADMDEALRSVFAVGGAFCNMGAGATLFTRVQTRCGTNFDIAIDAAEEALSAARPADRNIVLFLTDGEPSEDNVPVYDALQALGDHAIDFTGLQIGNPDVTPDLQRVADLIDEHPDSTGAARAVLDANDLAVETLRSFDTVAVTVNGRAAVVDAAGAFFHPVVIEPGANEFEVTVFDVGGGSCTRTVTIVGTTDDGDEFEDYSDVTTSIDAEYENTRFDRRAGRLVVQARACNVDEFPIDGPLLMVIERFTEPGVTAANPDGFTPDGKPYWVFGADGESIGPGTCTDPRTLLFADAGRVRVDFDVSWLAPINQAPTFVTVPTSVAIVDHAYTYTARAEDPDGDVVTYAVNAAPEGLTIGAESGVLSWHPDADDIGTHVVTLVASDGRGGRAKQRFALEVLSGDANRPPTFTTLPPTRVSAGAPYRYVAAAEDLDDDPLTFSKTAGPDGLTVDAVGIVEWDLAVSGEHAVGIAVSDGRGGESEQTFTLTVGARSNNANAPSLFGTPPTLAVLGSFYFYQPAAGDLDEGDTLTFALLTAPAGMMIEPDTGRVAWTPRTEQLGTHPVTLIVSDEAGASASQSWNVELVAEPVNRPPVVSSVPVFDATTDVAYEYDVDGFDLDGQLIMFQLATAPDGMSIDAASGLVTWTPSAAGLVVATVHVVDPLGAVGSQSWEIVVRLPNRAPVIETEPVVDGRAGMTYRYDVHASDADGDELEYTVTTGPFDMIAVARSGLVTWTPSAEDVGEHPVIVVVVDGRGGSDLQEFVVTVAADDEAPEVALSVSRDPGRVGEEVRICVEAADDVGIAERALTIDGEPPPLDAFGCATYVPTEVGELTLRATATDRSGNESSVERPLLVIGDQPTDAPVVTLVGPDPQSVLTAPTAIVASISDETPEILTWTVQISPSDDESFEVIATGSGAVDSDVVATIDTTRHPNGVYRVQIVANDGEQTGGIEVEYSVSGDLKIGNFTMAFVDIALPIGGVPMSVVRRYDSIDTSPGDFGAGWRLALPGDVTDSARESRTGNGLVDLLSTEPFRAGTRVFVTRPDGGRSGFTFVPTPTGHPTAFLFAPSFEPDPGVEDSLEVIEPAGGFFFFGGVATQLGVPYNPRKYRLTTADGFAYTIDENAGLELIADRAGNTVEVREDGLFSSLGPAIRFERDDSGRITRVVEPDGDPNDDVDPLSVSYVYDDIGNLIAFADEAGVETEYFYESDAFPHHVTRIVDPLGRPVARNVYDEDGRLIAFCGADGDPDTLEGCTSYERDIGVDGVVTTVFDGRGQRTDLFYDADGNVVREVREVDGETFEYERTYVDGRLVEDIDPAGNRTTYGYDERGRRTSVTDAGGRTSTFEYGDCGKLVRECDPQGNCKSYEYDASCNRIAEVDALGHRVEIGYDAAGSKTSHTDALGNAWTYEYDDSGRGSRIVDPQGSVETYDADDAGRLRATVDRLGRRIEYEYDDAGRVTVERWMTDPPRELVIEYDAAGEIVSASDEDSSIAIEYWQSGLMKSVTTQVTGGPAVTITYGLPDGADSSSGYDGARNVSRVHDSFGGLTEYEYDGLGRLVSIRQSGDGVQPKRVDRVLDAAGLVRELRRYADLDAQSPVTTTLFDYDCGGCPSRLASIEHRRAADDSVIHALAFDRSDAGDIVRMTDAEGVHDYTYDGARRLLSVDHPDGGAQPDESYTYDAAGNRLTSHRGASTYSYEEGGAGNRLVEDATWSYEYDAAGNLVRRTDTTTGERDVYRYDYRDRLVGVERRNALDEVTSETVYTYDLADRRLRRDRDGEITYWVWERDHPIIELDGDGDVTTRRLFGPRVDEVLADEHDGETRWFLTDPVGTVRDLVGDDGAVLDHYAYDSFGDLLAHSDTDVANSILFQGREFDAQTGLGYFRARYYSAQAGRFLAEDPIEPFDYTFANNGPLTFGDPSGRTVAIFYACKAAAIALQAQGIEESLGAPLRDAYTAIAESVATGEAAASGQSLAEKILKGLKSFLEGKIKPGLQCAGP